MSQVRSCSLSKCVIISFSFQLVGGAVSTELHPCPTLEESLLCTFLTLKGEGVRGDSHVFILSLGAFWNVDLDLLRAGSLTVPSSLAPEHGVGLMG